MRKTLKFLLQLETDPALLIPKAQTALARYGHQVVIGNTLHRRKFEVVFVSPISNHVSLEDEGSNADRSTPMAPPLEPSASSTSSSSLNLTVLRNTNSFKEEWLTISQEDVDKGLEIEIEIVRRLVDMHSAWTKI